MSRLRARWRLYNAVRALAQRAELEGGQVVVTAKLLRVLLGEEPGLDFGTRWGRWLRRDREVGT